MSKFITNQEQLLSEVINKILPSTEKLYLLVGYFYFSGFGEIYKNIEDKEMKILVGMDIEKGLGNKIKEFYVLQNIDNNITLSNKQIKDNFYDSLNKIINDTDFFDKKEKIDAFKIFLNKIKNGTLAIRKTKENNHAKMYLFENKHEHNQGGMFPGTLITGSSNLTASGLKHRFEVNVIFRDEHYNEGKKLFDEIWDSSVEIADKNNVEDFLNEVVEKTWIEKIPKPFLLFLRVLKEYFSTEDKEILTPSEITGGEYFSVKYQIDAIKQGMSIIKKHGGVIIADVVGLGKSIIASAIAHNLGLRTIIIAPPHLKKQWKDYSWEFRYQSKIYTSGKIEDAVMENTDNEEKLIIIDEAHKYRNEETFDYGNLHRLCQGNKIILLTATPFNNIPQDIFALIKLFQIPLKTTIQSIENLSYRFIELIAIYKKIKRDAKARTILPGEIKKRIGLLAKEIRNIIGPLFIRRSRLDLDAIEEYKNDLKLQNIKFPKVHDPIILEYELGDLSDLYINTLEEIAPEDEEKGFQGARYKPLHYVKKEHRKKIASEFSDENLFEQSQINLAKFMRRLLVMRFESSIEAFRWSLDSLISSSKHIVEWHDKLGKVPIYKKGNLPDVDTLLESNDDTDEKILEETLDEQLGKYFDKGLIVIKKDELEEGYIDLVKKDIELLESIKERWDCEPVNHDPKLDHFKNLIQEKLKREPNRKILVFTEFADTANYLYEELKDDLRVFKYTSRDANDTNKNKIINNFDASVEGEKRENDFDVLIATDAISEGFNLHRAGAVFNYDIPYNPTRVIQRVGRINRIDKKVFDILYIYNFFPTATGERETRKKQISTFKISLINALLGEDTKVLTSEEELKPFFSDRFKEQLDSQEELSWDAEYRDLLYRYSHKYPEFIEEAMKLPHRVRIRRTEKKDESGILVFAKKGNDYIFKLGKSRDEIKAVPAEDAFPLFEADINEKPKKESENFEGIYSNIKKDIFRKITAVPYEKGKMKTIEIVEWLKENVKEKKDYLEDLYRVLKDLDGLNDYDAKKIRGIELNDPLNAVKILEDLIPHSYIAKIIEKANSIEEGEEFLILSEELI